MARPAPEVVTLHVWRIRRGAVPAALARVGRDRSRVRAMTGVGFAKLFGTARRIGSPVAEPRRWALLVAWSDRERAESFDHSPVARGWETLSEEVSRLELRPLVARGRWAGHEPFGSPQRDGSWSGPVLALTRARLRPSRAVRFWRAVPPVAGDLADRPGLRLALGVGEAPFGFQGTVSVWADDAALRDYAYADGPHRQVIQRTPVERWYAEELFARFAVTAAIGTVDGRPILVGGPA